MTYKMLNVPEKLDLLLEQFEEMKGLLEKNQPPKAVPQNLDLDSAIAFMSEKGYPTSKSSMYKRTSMGQIPFSRFGSKLVFDRDDLMQWCKDNTNVINVENELVINLAAAANKRSR